MSVMGFNEFQRLLQKHSMDERTAFFFTMMQEQIGELHKANEAAAKAILALTQTVEQVVDLHAVTQERVRNAVTALKESGVDVASVATEPEVH